MDQQQHPFEAAGLGIAPFECFDVKTEPSKCQFCGTRIKYQFWICGSDKRTFFVGSECVNRTGGDDSVAGYEREKRSHERRLRRAKEEKERREMAALQAEFRRQRKAEFESEHPHLLREIMSFSKLCMERGDWSSGRYVDQFACKIIEQGYLPSYEINRVKGEMQIIKQKTLRKNEPKKGRRKESNGGAFFVPIGQLFKEGR